MRKLLNRIEFIVFPLAALVITMAVWVIDQDAENSRTGFIDYQQELLWSDAEEVEQGFVDSIEQLHGLARLISDWPAGERMERLEPALEAIIHSSSQILQIRYIDHRGEEILRFDRNASSITQPELQNKKDRYYVREGLNRPAGSFYISKFDLNIEQGVVETPWKPTYRTTLRVQLGDGELDGILVINTLAKSVIESLTSDAEQGVEIFLVNEEGFWLEGPEIEDNWGFMFGRETGLSQHPDSPEDSSDLLNPEAGAEEGVSGGFWLSTPVKVDSIPSFDVAVAERWFVLRHLQPSLIAPSSFWIANPWLFSAAVILLSGLLFYLLRQQRLQTVQEERTRVTHKLQEKNRNDLEAEVERRTRELEDALSFIRAVTDRLPMVIGLWDKDLSCRFLNRCAVEMFGVDPDQSIGKPLGQIIGQEIFEASRPLYDTVLGGKEMSRKIKLVRHSDKNERLFHVSYYPLEYHPGCIGILSVASDITEENELSETLRQRTLEAEQASVAKSAFLANMSHEIRTPMNGVTGMLMLLQETRQSREQASFTEKALQAANSLMHLLNDILDISKLNANKMTLEHVTFSTEDLIEKLLDLFALEAERKGIRLEVQIDPAVPVSLLGDPARIGQILINLVGNAIKFTQKGRVNLAVSCSEQSLDGLRVEFSVKDTGIGMGAEQLERVFEEFSQADQSTSRRFGGSGLGLAIAQKLVRMMDGEVYAQSVPGEGSKFTVSLPMKLSSGVSRYRDFEKCETTIFLVEANSELVALCKTYAPSWGLQPRLLSPSCTTAEIAENVQAASTDKSVILVDGAWLQTSEFRHSLFSWLEQAPTEDDARVLIVVPASGASNSIEEFEAAGAVLTPRPMTPSKLYDLIADRQIPGIEASVPLDLPNQKDVAQLENLTVLVVDDVELNRFLAQQILQRWGVRVDCVASGAESVEAVELKNYDVVLMDVHMDGMSGLEATRQIKAAFTGTETQPVIAALSASAMEEDKKAAFDAGMDAYLTKPINPRDLYDLLEACSNSRMPPSEWSVDAETEESPEASADRVIPAFIDERHLRDIIGADADVFLATLGSFEASMSPQIPLLETAFNENDVGLGIKIAHRIKGAAVNVADLQLSNAASNLESSLREGGFWKDAEKLINLLREHLHEVRVYIDNAQKKSPLAPESREELIDLLAEISGKFGERRFVTKKELELVLSGIRSEGHPGQAEKLAQSVYLFDYESAQKQTIEILELLK